MLLAIGIILYYGTMLEVVRTQQMLKSLSVKGYPIQGAIIRTYAKIMV